MGHSARPVSVRSYQSDSDPPASDPRELGSESCTWGFVKTPFSDDAGAWGPSPISYPIHLLRQNPCPESGSDPTPLVAR
jgi:hypothetical protein